MFIFPGLLGLARNDFSGPLPPELGNLQNLGKWHKQQKNSLDSLNQYWTLPIALLDFLLCRRLIESFDLSVNNFDGTIPTEFGELSELGMYGNKILSDATVCVFLCLNGISLWCVSPLE